MWKISKWEKNKKLKLADKIKELNEKLRELHDSKELNNIYNTKIERVNLLLELKLRKQIQKEKNG